MDREVVFFTNLQIWLATDDQDGLSWKMFQDSSVAIKGRISEPSSVSWMNSGMVWRGEFLTQNILERPNEGDGYSLWAVMAPDAPLQFFLTTAELQSLLTRANVRGKPLPADLETAIKQQISTLSKMPQLEEYIRLARKGKGTALMAKVGPLTQGEEVMLYVRHMLPSEYEKLQGFPVEWTQIDTEVLEML